MGLEFVRRVTWMKSNRRNMHMHQSPWTRSCRWRRSNNSLNLQISSCTRQFLTRKIRNRLSLNPKLVLAALVRLFFLILQEIWGKNRLLLSFSLLPRLPSYSLKITKCHRNKYLGPAPLFGFWVCGFGFRFVS